MNEYAGSTERSKMRKVLAVAVTILMITTALLALVYIIAPEKISAAVNFVVNPGEGNLTPYLMGHWDTREQKTTRFYVMNPTSQNMTAIIMFLTDEERLLKGVRARLSKNDVVEVDARRYMNTKSWGVVKVISVDPILIDSSPTPEVVLQPGIKGFQKELFLQPVLSSYNPPQANIWRMPSYTYTAAFRMGDLITSADTTTVKISGATEANLKEIPGAYFDAEEHNYLWPLIVDSKFTYID